MTNTSAAAGQPLSRYGGKRVSVVLSLPSGEREICGPAEYERDPLLGNVLRVTVDTPATFDEPAELLISEAEWEGKISGATGQESEQHFEYRFHVSPS